jgi:hypothetical protein
VEQLGDRFHGQRPSRRWGGCGRERGEWIASMQFIEPVQRGGVELAQRRPQLVSLALSGPAQVLVDPGQYP